MVNEMFKCIQVDLDRLIQVLLNLYLNVIYVIGCQGMIIVEVKESGIDCVIIIVIDSGKGIVLDQLEVIFMFYFMIKVDGIGLGLVVV